MNVNEYGNFIRIQFDEDISNNINKMHLISPPPYNTSKEFTVDNGLSVGTGNFNEGGVKYISNQYIEYQIKEGDITATGVYTIKFESVANNNSFKKLNDSVISFRVSK